MPVNRIRYRLYLGARRAACPVVPVHLDRDRQSVQRHLGVGTMAETARKLHVLCRDAGLHGEHKSETCFCIQ